MSNKIYYIVFAIAFLFSNSAIPTVYAQTLPQPGVQYSNEVLNIDPYVYTNEFKQLNNIYFYEESDTCLPSSGSTVPVSGDEALPQIYNYFITELGLSPIQALGFIGNLQAESSLDPAALNSIGAYGIVQWLYGRKTALQNTPGYDTLEGQLAFIKTELEGNYYGTRVYEPLRQATDLREATDIVLQNYEIPCLGDTQCAPYLQTRYDFAVDAAEKLGIDIGASSSTTTGIDLGASTSVETGATTGLPNTGSGQTNVACGAAGFQFFNTDLSGISLSGIDPSQLSMPPISNSGLWNAQTADVAKILWSLFSDDFSHFLTYNPTSGTSCHPSAAIDMMIDDYTNPAVRARMEAIAEFLMQNRNELQISGIIYYEKKSYGLTNTSTPYSNWAAYTRGYDDNTAHRNHIHISIYPCMN